MYLTKDQLKQLIQNKPPGVSDDQILKSLLRQGHTFEDMDKISPSFFAEVKSQMPQKKEGFLKRAGKAIAKGFLAGERGLAKDIGATKETFTSKEALQMSQDSNKLIEQARKLPMGDPRRRELLEKAAQTTGISAGQTQQRLSEIPSNKRVLGNIALTATDILAAGTYSKAGLMGAGKLTTGLQKGTPAVISGVQQATRQIGFKAGAKAGAVAGAKAGILPGAGYGAGMALREEKSGGEVVVSGIIGAGLGAATGAVIGGITGGIGGARNKRIIEKYLKGQKEGTEALMLKPGQMSKKEYQEAVRQGLVTPQTKTQGAKLIPSDDQIKLGQKYSDLLSKEKTTVGRINTVNDAIRKESHKISDYLKDSGKTYNTNEYRKFLEDNLKDFTDIMVPKEEALDRAKMQAIDDIIDSLPDNTLENLYKGRIKFDQVIDKRLNAFNLQGSSTVKKNLYRLVRDTTQEYITRKLGNDTYKTSMATQFEMYRMLDMLEDVVGFEKGRSGFELWLANHQAVSNMYKTARGWLIPAALTFGAVKLGLRGSE